MGMMMMMMMMTIVKIAGFSISWIAQEGQGSLVDYYILETINSWLIPAWVGMTGPCANH